MDSMDGLKDDLTNALRQLNSSFLREQESRNRGQKSWDDGRAADFHPHPNPPSDDYMQWGGGSVKSPRLRQE